MGLIKSKRIGRPGIINRKPPGLLLRAEFKTGVLTSDITFKILTAFSSVNDSLVKVKPSDKFGLIANSLFTQASSSWSTGTWEMRYFKRDQNSLTELFQYQFSESLSCEDPAIDKKSWSFGVQSDGSSGYSVEVRQVRDNSPTARTNCLAPFLKTLVLFNFPEKETLADLELFNPDVPYLKSFKVL